jgi:predicted small lipoprotein YifL
MRLAVLTAAALLAACGQTGALYLPDEGIETPVEIRGPATPAQSPPSQTTPEAPPAPEEDKDKKPTPPTGS